MGNLVLSFFVLACFQEHWSIVLASLQEAFEKGPCFLSVSAPSFKKSSFKDDSPSFVDVGFSLDLLDHCSDLASVLAFLFALDCFDEQVVVEWVELEALHNNVKTRLIVSTLLFHLCEL
jgi:hypothetical protein